MNTRYTSLVVIGVILAITLSQSLYTVHQTQKALVLQLGEPVSDAVEPGLHVKLPFVQNVVYFDSRLMAYDARPAEALTSDKKTIVLDSYSRWRITDPLTFYRTMRTVAMAQGRLDDRIYSDLREVVGRYTLTEIVSTKRQEIMEAVIAQANNLLKQYGVEIVDVRIKRADLPAANQRAVFGRMQAERERQAKQYRSEGLEESTKIKSAADKDQVVILAEARKNAEIIRGEGDAQAVAIFAEVLSKDPAFYEFSKSLEAYKKALKERTRIMLTPGEGFLKYLN